MNNTCSAHVTYKPNESDKWYEIASRLLENIKTIAESESDIKLADVVLGFRFDVDHEIDKGLNKTQLNVKYGMLLSDAQDSLEFALSQLRNGG